MKEPKSDRQSSKEIADAPAARRRDDDTEAGWWGRVTAALIGGSLLSFAVAVAVTIYVPGFDGLDQAFMGGLILVAIWPPIMLWVLFARTGWRAWKRVLIPMALFLALDVTGLML